MHVIKSLSDEVICMHLGAVIARGDPESVLADADVVSAYLGFDDTAVQRSGSDPRLVSSSGKVSGA
jgi:ABC-type hemin transport system ATPase subunit